MRYLHVIPVAGVDTFPAPTNIVFATPGGELPGRATISIVPELPFTHMTVPDLVHDVSRLLRERLSVYRFEQITMCPQSYESGSRQLIVHPCCVVLGEDDLSRLASSNRRTRRTPVLGLEDSLRLLHDHPWQAPMLDWLFASQFAAGFR